MLDNFIYSVNVIFPVFALVGLGFLLGRIGFLSEAFIQTAEKLVFKVALPVMLFLEASKSKFSVGVSARLIIFCVLSVTFSFIIITLLSRFFVTDIDKRGAFVQGSCRSNFAVLGIPLAASMFGDAGIECIAILMPFVIIMFNSYSVIVLSLFSSEQEKTTLLQTIKKLLVNIIKNPLIISVVIAVPFMLTGWQLPTFAGKSLEYISNLATPLALICLGANFKYEELEGRMKETVLATVIKTVLLPLIVTSVAAFMGYRNEALGTIFILFASPSAVSSYIMAKNMKNDSDLAAHILLFTTLTCIITIFTGVFILKNASLI